MKGTDFLSGRAFGFFTILLFCLIFFSSPSPVQAMQVHLSFDQLVEKADLVFLGTVVRQQSRYGANFNMIFTDVYFEIDELIHRRQTAQPIEGRQVILTFAGGRVAEEVIRVSDVPTLETGTSYLILTRMDGKTYASPIIGAYQGLFRVIHDEVTGISYPLTYGKRCIQSIDKGILVTGPALTRIRGGMVESKGPTDPMRIHEVTPKPVQGIDARVSSVFRMREQAPEKIMTLDELLHEILSRIQPN